MTDIDKVVGARIRMYRKMKGLSQTDLANSIGVRFQQVQKYESGSNRVAASRLWKIADALDVPIATLFKDLVASSTAAQHDAEAIEIFRRLRPDARLKALDYLRALSELENAEQAKAVG